MRLLVLLASTSLLAACGGGGAQSVNSTPAPPTGAGTPSGGTANTTHTFANPTEAKTYTGIGGNQVYEYNTDDRYTRNQQGEKYAGNTTTIRNSSIKISYNPADAIYELVVNDPTTGAQTNTRFQDPASRTDFGGTKEPQWGTPNLLNTNIQYLQAGDGNPRSPYDRSGNGFVDSGTNDIPPSGTPGSSYQSTSLFLLKPGKETQYVTFAGYVRNALSFASFTLEGETVEHDQTLWHLERGAFAYGATTAKDAVPTLGTGTYTGSMLASMIFNPTIDGQDASGLNDLPNYFQWIEGTANIAVDFAQSAFSLNLSGQVLEPQIDQYTAPAATVLPAGARFTASGKGDINLVNFGGFKGFVNSASFTAGTTQRAVNIAGSTIDGAFYGPKGEEVGGGFRIVGGNPDERIDILGAFVGKK